MPIVSAATAMHHHPVQRHHQKGDRADASNAKPEPDLSSLARLARRADCPSCDPLPQGEPDRHETLRMPRRCRLEAILCCNPQGGFEAFERINRDCAASEGYLS